MAVAVKVTVVPGGWGALLSAVTEVMVAGGGGVIAKLVSLKLS